MSGLYRSGRFRDNSVAKRNSSTTAGTVCSPQAIVTKCSHAPRPNVSMPSDSVSLDKLAESVVEQFRTQTEKHTFTTDFAPHFPAVPGDTERLRQVLNNLLNNAIKYSPRGGAIVVSGRALPDQVIISVQDEGIGVDPADHQRIFERFARVDNSSSRKTQGAGLGLYLVRAIVEAHQGHVWVESNMGEGAEFSFSLPRN